jgi:imidazole glycerol-phosphate synthase subunit HisF
VIDPRIIPCLLLADGRLVKTRRFREPSYVGDPINTINIFSALGADEILLLDIGATRQGHGPDPGYLAKLAEESSVPVGYGGGIRTLEEVREVLAAGVEKVVLGTIAGEDPGFIERAASLAGSQAVVVSIDVASDAGGHPRVWLRNGTHMLDREPAEYASDVEHRGAGEILVYSIERDGMMAGYDMGLTRSIAGAVGIPVIACGGAGRREDLREVTVGAGATAAAAGSIFVFQGANRSVLVNYFTRPQRASFFA